MRRESLIPFLPAALAAVTAGVTAAIVRAKQPDYPDSVIVFQIVMFGAALLAAVPRSGCGSQRLLVNRASVAAPYSLLQTVTAKCISAL